MIRGIGIDILNFQRFKVLVSSNPTLLERLQLTSPGNINYSLLTQAGFFAAKEALFKALPENEKNNIDEYRLSKEIDGRPFVSRKQESGDYCRDQQIQVSISHDSNNVIAIAVIF
jgi:holo-[acyl-carrier protein] synthase